MASIRKVVFANSQIYHIFNRGVERRVVFTNKREYDRMLRVMRYYRFAHVPMRYSRFAELPDAEQFTILQKLSETAILEVKILAYCLMPNHFHLILKQENTEGISRYVSNISNSYSKYFNTKHHRIGPLFQGAFKAIWIETDEQLVHLSRYIHLNPITSFLVKEKNLDMHIWSSLPEYLSTESKNILSDPSIILGIYGSKSKYKDFVHDQIQYAQQLEKIKHLMIEE
ncbi:MAG: hypothetical protein EPN88_15315 [Bacteroidetes bacterium]|nr:MAG: hypothetical protein EPN88_15315 [Bacteroidota bacterium]